MKVDTQHAQYSASLEFWTRARDTYAGEDAVKAGGQTYLPQLGSHKLAGGGARYQMYLQRAFFYNAVGRTIEGLSGVALRADPQIEAPSNVDDVLKDVTLRNQSIDIAAQATTREILTTGREGILVDVNDAGRPYWTFWRAEDIVNWRVDRRAGNPELTLVVLREAKRIETGDPFVEEMVETYRVLTLTEGVYGVTSWRKDERGTWVADATVAPKRRGKTLEFIPFTFVNPTGTTAPVEKPPLLDLINVNLSHYLNAADLEHGLHFVGVPQIVISGVPSTGNDPFEFGSSVVWVLDQGGKAEILQADGETLGALERALARKQKYMATLGARLLEDQATTAETATAVLGRSAGEHATLGTIVNAIEQAYTLALKTAAWWAPGNTQATPDEVQASVEFSKDFGAAKIDPTMLRELVNALQADAISFKTFWEELAKRQFGRPVEAGVELKEIEHGAEGPFKKQAPPPMIPGLALDDKGNPIKDGDDE